MAVFRVERTKNYTVMSNHHLRNPELTLKAKGLLSMMLSLPEAWSYSIRGLAAICKEGVDAIGAALKELETQGYIVRHQLRDDKGRISDTEYVIYELPHTDCPYTENPYMDKPDTAQPDTENREETNIDITSNEKSNKNLSIIPSIPFLPAETAARPPDTKRSEAKLREIENYREIILENIDYDVLLQDLPYDHDRIEEIAELLVETVSTSKQYIRVAGNDYPADVVKSRFLKLNCEHIKYVFDCLKENTTKIRNIKQYLLTTLFNAPTTIDNYFSSLVNHDMYGNTE